MSVNYTKKRTFWEEKFIKNCLQFTCVCLQKHVSLSHCCALFPYRRSEKTRDFFRSTQKKNKRKKKTYFWCRFCCSLPKNRAQKYRSKQQQQHVTCRRFETCFTTTTRDDFNVFSNFFFCYFSARSLRKACMKEQFFSLIILFERFGCGFEPRSRFEALKRT